MTKKSAESTNTEQDVKIPRSTNQTEDSFGLEDDDLESEIAKAEKTTGGFDGPTWVPTLAAEFNPDIKESALLQKVAKAGPGSSTRRSVKGRLVAAFAWGRRLYFLDLQNGVRVKLPESKILYTGLNLCELGAQVGIRYDGPGKRAKPNQKPPHLYTVASLDRPPLTKAREDALVAESIDEREERRAREAEERGERVHQLIDTPF